MMTSSNGNIFRQSPSKSLCQEMVIRLGQRSPIGQWRQRLIDADWFCALLVFCAGNSPVPGEFSAQRPVTRSFDVFFDLHMHKQLSKQSRGWWFVNSGWLLCFRVHTRSLKTDLGQTRSSKHKQASYIFPHRSHWGETWCANVHIRASNMEDDKCGV